MTWRDVLPIHPAAAAYPRMSADELAELARDIKVRGLQVNVVLIRKDGKDLLLDGISRLDALELSGFDLVGEDGKLDRTLGLGGGSRVRVVADVDPVAMAASLNVHRRHLSAEDKRKHIERLLTANPEKSNRAIAKVAKVDDKTVAAVRAEKEATAEIPQLKKRTGADGKRRKQPARKTTTTRPSETKAFVVPAPRSQCGTIEAPVREENECTIEDASGKNWKKITSKEARAILTIDALRDANTRQLGLINKLQNENRMLKREAAAQQDLGPDSPGELERKVARLAELEHATHRLESENVGLRSEVEELQGRAPAAVTLQTAIETLIDEANRTTCFENVLPESAVYAAKDLDRVVDHLRSLNKFMAERAAKKAKAAPVKIVTPEAFAADDASTYRRHATGRSTEENAIMNTDGEPPSNRWGNSAPTIRED